MRAVFDHSWRRSAQRERHVLMNMSVFRGGFTRQAAEEVTGADLNILSGLIDSSWLQLNLHNRYEIHELTRQYVEHMLDAAPSTATIARAAHAAYYAALANRIGMESKMGGSTIELNILVVELDNIWAGWHWMSTQRDFDELSKYTAALKWLADSRGLYGEVIAEFENACTLAREICGERFAAHHGSRSDHDRTSSATKRALLPLWRDHLRGAWAVWGGEHELLRKLKMDGRGELLPTYLDALLYMSLVTAKYADYRQARSCCEEVMHLTQGTSEFRQFSYSALNSLAQVAYLQGNFAEARAATVGMSCSHRPTTSFVP